MSTLRHSYVNLGFFAGLLSVRSLFSLAHAPATKMDTTESPIVGNLAGFSLSECGGSDADRFPDSGYGSHAPMFLCLKSPEFSGRKSGLLL